MKKLDEVFGIALFWKIVLASFQTRVYQSVSSLDGHIATNGTETTSRSLIRCAMACKDVPTCLSLFFTSGQSPSNCQLHNQIFSEETGLINKENTKYYRVSDFNDCNEWYQHGYDMPGIYSINLAHGARFPVRCDISPDTGGWIVIQQRSSASDFYKTWAEYKDGFGDLNGNFWLGNEKIWTLTKDGHWKLRVELTYGNESGYAEYDTFAIGDEASNYVLSVGGYSGNIGDSLLYHNGFQFSTLDRDNDIYVSSCAQTFHGAWWYAVCHHSNLNGDFGNAEFGKGINWYTWKGHVVSVDSSKLMIEKVI